MRSITVIKAPSRDTPIIIRDPILTTTNHLSIGAFQLFPKQLYAPSCYFQPSGIVLTQGDRSKGGANRTIHYARGKTLGGSSARNYMVYHRSVKRLRNTDPTCKRAKKATRPTRGALQKWADQVGDQSYTFDNFLPFYRKSCNYTPYNAALYNSTILPQEPGVSDPAGGPLHVSFSNYADAFGTWAQKAFVAVGMKVLSSLNAGILNGSAYSTLTIDPRNGYRSSSESSFLQAALQNGSAPMIYKNSLARKLLFNGTLATGVLVTTAGSYGVPELNFSLTARKEVIVCAGAFQSPQLLMVSGIGPQHTLQKYGIEVVKDLPGVGQNMWDHILFGANRRVNVQTASASLNSPVAAAKLADQFRANGSGPLAAFGAGYYGWEKIPSPYRGNLSDASIAALGTFPDDWPELEWLPISAYLGYQTNRQAEDPRDGYNYATINPGLVAPLFRGNITIGQYMPEAYFPISIRRLGSSSSYEIALTPRCIQEAQIWRTHRSLTPTGSVIRQTRI